jgi:hypothetical protein
MIKELRLRNYSPNTITVYIRCVAQFAQHFRLSPEGLGPEHIRQYPLFLVQQKKVSWVLFNQTVYALRFFYHHILHRDWMIEYLPYPRREDKLPVVLSPAEVAAVFEATHNLKHRTILMTTLERNRHLCRWLAGFRAHAPRGSDIDSQRQVICVHQGKGRKDRQVMLSPKLLERVRTGRIERSRGATPSGLSARNSISANGATGLRSAMRQGTRPILSERRPHQLRRRNERCEAPLEQLVTILPQSCVARARREPEALGGGIAFLMHPAHPRPSPRDIRVDSLRQRGVPAQALGQHARVLHRHAAALAHHWGARMRGIADEYDAAAMPFLECHPVDWRAMDLLVARQRGEVFLDDGTEIGEAAAQAVEAARHRLVGARLGDVAETIGAPVAYRAESKEATLTQQKLQAGEAARSDWRDAAPRHGTGIDGQRRVQLERAHGRRDPVCTNHQVVGT